MMVRRSFVYDSRKRVSRTATAWVGSQKLCHPLGLPADVNQKSYNHPNVEREHKLQPQLAVNVHPMEETSLNTKV